MGTLRLQKKHEKLFWKCIFTLLNLKRKVNIEGLHAYCFSHILSQTEIKLKWLPMTPFLVYMHGTCLTLGKPFVRKPYKALVYFWSISLKSVEVPIELSEDCYCSLSVPIPNEQTLVTRYVLLSYYEVFFSFGSLIQVLGICTIIHQQLVAMLQAHLRFLYQVHFWYGGCLSQLD